MSLRITECSVHTLAWTQPSLAPLNTPMSLPKVTEVRLELYGGFSGLGVEQRPLLLRLARGAAARLVRFHRALQFCA